MFGLNADIVIFILFDLNNFSVNTFGIIAKELWKKVKNRKKPLTNDPVINTFRKNYQKGLYEIRCF